MTPVDATNAHHRKRRRALLLGVALIALFALGDYVAAFGQAGRHWWADLGWSAVALAAAVACGLVARRESGPIRRAWTSFALGCASWFIGMLVWDYLELVRHVTTPFPSLADLFFLLLPPLFVVGLMQYRADHPTGALTAKGLADFGLIASATVICSLIVLFEPLHTLDEPILYKATALAYPTLEASAFLFALLIVLRHAWDRSRGVVILIAASLGLHAYTDTLYAYSLLTYAYEAGHYLDVFWVAAFVLIGLAAYEQTLVVGESGPAMPGSVYEDRVHDLEALLPAAVLAVVALTALAFHENLQHDIVVLVTPFAVLFVSFVALHEWTSHRLRARLFGEVQASAEQLRSSERELSNILRTMQDTYYRTDAEGRLVKASDSVSSLLGYAPEQLLGVELASLYVDPAARRSFLDSLVAHDGSVKDVETALRHRSGATVWVSTNAHYVRDADGRVVGVEGTTRDITDRKQADARMHKLSSALQQTADSVLITDRGGIIEYVNPAFETVTGYTSTEAVGNTPRLVKSGRQPAEFYKRLWDTILGGEVFSDIFINRRKDGSLYYEAKTITPLKDDTGAVTNFISTGKDITEQMQTQEQLQFMAHHDALTELPNRALFLDRVKQALARARWHERLVGIMFLDLDRFKNINDSLGHDVGDRLLRQIARRLSTSVRDGDTVARFGGDEFVILLDDVASDRDIEQLAERVLEVLNPPFEVDGRELHVTASIGISLYPGDGDDSQTLLRHADIAMYRAKDFGKNNYKFFSDEMSARAFQHLTLENSLRHALERDEFELYYQPQVDIETCETIGVEALLRWRHPDLGLVGPGEFVPLLEETGLIVPVGEWVLRTACEQVAAWHDGGFRNLRLAVNLSARQFNEPRLRKDIKRIVQECGIDPTALELEMTESVFMRNAQATTETLRALNEMGVRLAIDDFGTGYSSLSYLKRFPIHTLKIDRSFVRDIATDPDDAALSSAIIVMAQSLDLEVVAEGVETEAQVVFLHAHGCRYMQGYYFSHPQPAADLAAYLSERKLAVKANQ